jgi:hypothetical protein
LGTTLAQLGTEPPDQLPTTLAQLAEPVINITESIAAGIGIASLAAHFSTVGLAITIAQFVFDALTILDAVIVGTLHTVYTFP